MTDIKTETGTADCKAVSEAPEKQISACCLLLGGGKDLTGMTIRAFGHDDWLVTGKNYKGDWSLLRTESRPDGIYRVVSAISIYELPTDHGHYAEIAT